MALSTKHAFSPPWQDVIGPHIETYFPCGSRRTCNPAPTNTDDDYLVLATPETGFGPHPSTVECLLVSEGFVVGGSLFPDEINQIPPTDRFMSYKKGETNLIVTQSVQFFNRFVLATQLATRFNLLHKPDRIALFQAVLYGRGV